MKYYIIHYFNKKEGLDFTKKWSESALIEVCQLLNLKSIDEYLGHNSFIRSWVIVEE